MGFFSQLGLLLWKNWILQKRRICVSIFEIILPLFFAVCIVLMRMEIDVKHFPYATLYDSKQPELKFPEEDKNISFGFIPATSETQTLMEAVINSTMDKINCNLCNYKVMGFDTEEQAVSHSSYVKDMMPFVIVFDMSASDSALPKRMSYTMRPFVTSGKHPEEIWRTKETFPFFQMGPRSEDEDPDYNKNGVALLQIIIGEALANYWLEKEGKAPIQLNVQNQRLSYPPHYTDPMVLVIQHYFPLFLVLSFILSVVINTKNLVYEKEKKLKESMKLMGLHASVHWVSWFVTFAIYLFPTLAVYALLFGLKVSESVAVLTHSDLTVFFVFMLCYGVALITFCFMISSFVQKANIGAAVSGILYFLSYFPVYYFGPQYANQSKIEKLATGLFFNGALSLGAKIIGMFEGIGEGAQWNNFAMPVNGDDNISLLECMLLLLFDSIIHLIITWYMDNIWPGDFGVPQPYLFFLTKSYWLGPEEISTSSYEIENKDTKLFEKDPTNMKAGIKIAKLNKVFGSKVAVKDVSLQMYEGQITVLLGHNGAGKTSTMSMLTGFIPPTSGTALVNGCDIRHNIQGVRESLGLCPQHDILFESLTVKEHLSFFYKLKGGSCGKQMRKEVLATVKEVGLEAKLNVRSVNLSGGQKRKLSVGIALIGGSKIVILDEPTSGMDPAARRQTWGVLQEARRERTVMLSTHYMDEADVLGDRIAIMVDGVVKCCGSAMFLKKLFGAGYHLVVVKGPDCDMNKVSALIQSHVRTAKLEFVVNTEMSYLLPETEVSNFAALFTELDEKMEKLGITSFGTSATTMEEVFLKVGDTFDDEGPGLAENNRANAVEGFSNNALTGTIVSGDEFSNSAVDLPDDGTALSSKEASLKQDDQVEMMSMDTMCHTVVTTFPAANMSFNRGFTKITGLAYQWAIFKALFIKKAIHTWRSPFVTLVQVVLPLTMVSLGMLGTTGDRTIDKTRLLRFDLEPFGRSYVPYTAGQLLTLNPQPSLSFAELYKNQFGSSHNLELFQMPPYEEFSNYTLERADKLGLAVFNKKMIIGMEVQTIQQQYFSLLAHYSGQPYHALPISMNYLINTVLQFTLNDSFSLQSSLHLLPVQQNITESAENEKVETALTGFFLTFLITFGMAFLTSLFIYFPIKERQVGAKHMQVVSGVGPLTFWLPFFSWDFINFIIPGLLMLIVFAVYDMPAYSAEGRLGVIVLLLCFFGWAILPCMYVVQFAFHKPSTGVVVLIMLNIFTGLVTVMVVDIMRFPGLELKSTANTLDWIFMAVFVNYNFAVSFSNMLTNYLNNDFCKNVSCTNLGFPHPCCKDLCTKICLEHEESYLALNKPGIGANLLLLGLQGIFFFLVLMLIEYNIFQRLWYLVGGSLGTLESSYSPNEENNISMEDSDVAAEKQRINSNPASVLSSKERQSQPDYQACKNQDMTDSLLLVNLYKRYGSFVAVEHICVGVPDNECFGLLGQNGAGKTTTFKMLTGDVMVTGGNAYLKGYDVRNNIKQVQSRMGYCPQFDALLDKMTGRETLTMYARLRGVPEGSLPVVVNGLIDTLMLKPHADKLAGNYSGGNKRKLSTAISLVGDPSFIMLDEPSCGMDPKARRQLWNVLSQVRTSGRTLVLTSHSMEECDALCTRLAIMVNGKFVCLGSPQHLKNKFGQGYTLITQMAILPDGTTAPIQPLVNFIKENFQGAQVFDDHQGYVHFQVPSAGVKLAQIFSLMESAKANLSVEDYSVHQTTLEQIFLAFTRAQALPAEEKKPRSCCFLSRK